MTRSFANPVAHVCRVCGRPAQIDELCGRHGGSVGLVVQTEDLPRSLRIGLRLVVTGAWLTFFLGGLMTLIGGSLTGREDAPDVSRNAGFGMMAAGLSMLVVAMYLSQLRRWAVVLALAACVGIAAAGALLVVMANPASSFRTLILVTTILPFAVAAVLVAVWWAMEATPRPGAAAQRTPAALG